MMEAKDIVDGAYAEAEKVVQLEALNAALDDMTKELAIPPPVPVEIKRVSESIVFT